MKNRKLKDRKCPSLSLSVSLCLTVSICSLPSPWWVWSRSAAVPPPDSCCWCNSPWRSHKACLEDPHLSRRDHCHACPPLCVRLSSCKYSVLISAWWLCAFKGEAAVWPDNVVSQLTTDWPWLGHGQAVPGLTLPASPPPARTFTRQPQSRAERYISIKRGTLWSSSFLGH